jgi:putative hydrolase of the HAD superfamily
MAPDHAEILRRHCRPMKPIPTGQPPVLARLPGIRAVLFDLYGTLFISGSGEVGTSRKTASESALADALRSVGVPSFGSAAQGVECFFEAIEAFHAESKRAGIEWPEVDIVDVWAEVLKELARRRILPKRDWQRSELERLAVEYEARVNPVWPMPGLQECLRELSERRVLLGIVSNAQFYTPELFPALLGREAEWWGFDAELQLYSYRHGRAKPGSDLYELARRALSTRGIEPPEVLSVGNDMLNDVLPARRLGFRTGLFAADARSLRLREGHPGLDGVKPDVVLTRLAELTDRVLA